jgi:hypothetical protein
MLPRLYEAPVMRERTLVLEPQLHSAVLLLRDQALKPLLATTQAEAEVVAATDPTRLGLT